MRESTEYTFWAHASDTHKEWEAAHPAPFGCATPPWKLCPAATPGELCSWGILAPACAIVDAE